jgi:hypothetical protein
VSEGIRISKQKSRAKRIKSKKRKRGRKLVRGSEYPSKITRTARSKSKKRERGRK